MSFNYQIGELPQSLIDKTDPEVSEQNESVKKESFEEQRAEVEASKKAVAEGATMIKEIEANAVKSAVVDPKKQDGPRDAVKGKLEVKEQLAEGTTKKKKRGSIMAEALGSICEDQALNEINPPYNHGSAMSGNIAMREYALKYDLEIGKVLCGNEAARRQKEADAVKAGHV